MGHFIADAIFLIIGFFFVWIGIKEGLIGTIVIYSKTLLAYIAAYFLGGPVSNLIREKWLGNAIRGFVYNKINCAYQAAADSFDAQSAISSLPNFLMTEEMKAKLYAAEGSGEELVNSMTDSVSSPIASLFSNIIGYIVVFLIALIGLWIVASVLTKLIKHIKLFNTINTVLGCILGILIASVILFIIASILKYFFAESEIYTKSVIVKFFGESPLLQVIKFLNVGSAWFAELLG